MSPKTLTVLFITIMNRCESVGSFSPWFSSSWALSLSLAENAPAQRVTSQSPGVLMQKQVFLGLSS